MKQQDVNILLVVGIIILFVANLFMFLNFIEDSLNFGESGVLVGMMICGVLFILIIIVSVILFLFVYKKIIGRKILVILSVILIILLCGFAVNIFINAPVSGSKIYDSDTEPDQTKIFGNYVTWLSENEVYLLNIDDKSATNIGSAAHGPIIYEDKVFFENSNLIYQYTISTKETEQITNGSGVSLDVYGENIIWFENQSIYLFNISKDLNTIINSDNITLPILISDDYIVWRERVKSFNYSSFDTLFAETVDDYSNAWYESGVFNFWIYDLTNNEKIKVLSNITQLIYFGEPTIDIYEDTIVYTNNLSIYTYDISTGENKERVEHSRINEIQDSGRLKRGYIRDVLIYGNNIVFGEHYSEVFKYDGTKYRYYNISNGKNFEIDIWAYDIYENYIVGWAGPYSGKTNGDYELYLIEI